MKKFQHSVFWICVLTLLTLVFGKSYNSYKESFYFVCMLLPVVVATTYFFNYILVPRYLLCKQYQKFILYFLYLLIISLNLEMYVVTAAFAVLAKYQYANMNPITTDVFVLTITLYFVVLGLSFVRLIRFYFQNQHSLTQLNSKIELSSLQYLQVVENRKNIRLQLDQILYIESLADYVKIHCERSAVTVTKEKISKLSNQLPAHFIRVHRSFIVNQHKVNSYNKEAAFIQETEIPISRSYKNPSLAILNGTSLVSST